MKSFVSPEMVTDNQTTICDSERVKHFEAIILAVGITGCSTPLPRVSVTGPNWCIGVSTNHIILVLPPKSFQITTNTPTN
jgi:hypothetical protein